MKPKQVLIISNPEDEHTVRVTDHLLKRGVEPILYYPENFGRELFLSVIQFPGQREDIVISTLKGDVVNLLNVDSVWYRRPRLVHIDETLKPEALEFARDEWKSALEGVYTILDKPIWVSHPDNLRHAARKPLQLRIAQSFGLNIPRTLITNSPEQARKFYEQCSGRVVMKATGSGWVYSRDGNDVYFVLTNRVDISDMQSDDEIAIAPVTFQEEIPKEYEIRVNIVGQQVLAIRIDSQRSEVSKLDWRRYDVQNTPYTPYTLPPEISIKCLKLTQYFGLEFGAIDLIRQPDGKYVFLEINGNGQFLWAEELSGVKVSEALADLLAGVAPPLKSAQL